MNRLRSEGGVALAVAIFAMFVVGGTVAAALFVGSQEQRIGWNTLLQQQAFTAAEAANDQLVSSWNRDVYNSMTVGGAITTAGTAAGGQGWYRQSVHRLSHMLYLVRTDGFSRDSAARQRVGALLRLHPLRLSLDAALRTSGSVRLRGPSYISGIDRPPEGWTGCPSTADTLPGIRLPAPAHLETTGCLALNCIQGQPSVDSTASSVAEIPFESLKRYATKVMSGGQYRIQPSAVGGVCDTAVLENWGEPRPPGAVVSPGAVAECQTHFPIVWVDGSMTINQVRGQGVLIVNGDLDVQGEFDFYGPVLVRGSLRTTGAGARFTGGVVAGDASGDLTIRFSSCAVSRAITASAAVTLLRSRRWLGLY